MSDKSEPAIRSFNPAIMLSNIDFVRGMIQRIRQKEGGIGSEQDELTLHRMIHDIDFLVDMVDGIKASYDTLKTSHDSVATDRDLAQNQLTGIKDFYETMIKTRNERIKELEGQITNDE